MRSKNPSFRVTSSNLQPKWVPLPGDLKVTGTLEVYKPLNQSDLQLQLTLHRKAGFIWIKVPCIKGVGSCHYNLCEILKGLPKSGKCPHQLNELGCTCDTIEPGHYSMDKELFHIPKIQGPFAWLIGGTYAAKANIVDKSSGNQEACVYVETYLGN